MNNSFEDPADLDRDVVDLLAKAGPPPEQKMTGLLFSPRPDEILYSITAWNEQWRAQLDNSYYFRSDVADEIFDFDSVKCSIVKNAQWMEALETRNWSKHEIYGYNGYALFDQAPYLFDGITGSREEEDVFARAVDAYGGIDLTHLDEHGWLCSFTTAHDGDRDNPARTDKSWIKKQTIRMVIGVKEQIRASRILRTEAVQRDISYSRRVGRESIGPRAAFGVPCYWADEVTGQLAPAVQAYLKRQQLSSRHIECLRTYFRQWVQSRVWDMNPHATIESRRCLDQLRGNLESIQSTDEIGHWLSAARGLGLSPLR